MPSHLTRLVFRRLVANKPLLYRGCLYRPLRPRLDLHHGARWLAPASQRRHFFDLFKPQRKAKSADLPPGLETLTELMRLQGTGARPPRTSDVAQAFSAFFSGQNRRFEDFHIQVAIYAFSYLKEHPREDGTPWVSDAQIVDVLKNLQRPPKTGGRPHLAFATELSLELGARAEAQASTETELSDVDKWERLQQPLYISILCLYGASVQAREIAAQSWRPVHSTPSPPIHLVTGVWTTILRGLSREKNRDELLKTVSIMRELSIPFVHSMQDVLVTFFGESGDLEQARHWYSHPVAGVDDAGDTEPHSATYAAILKACARHGDLAFGHQVVASMLKKLPTKADWDAIFVWSAAIGKGADEVDRMMSVMVRRNDEARRQDASLPVVHPDIDTINALVEFSISKQDPYLAERYISLGEKRGIPPNAKTYTMQMEYRLSAKDIDGARVAYFGLQGAKDEASVLVTNKLVRAMCEAKQVHFDDIMAIVDDLHENKAWFEPETVAALCSLHLRRGEVADATDLIQVHAHHYSPSQRKVIRVHLIDFLLDRQNSTADGWDTYQMLRQLFPETERRVRINIMNEFFARGRSDMACHVFFHMRNHPSEDVRANADVYVAAFSGFGRTGDAESLELAHNQLKLDLSVELDTRLRNALMLAYAGTGNSHRALDYWDEIAGSKEGPSYSSIAIVFRSCEGMPFGDRHAKSIWRRLKEMDLDIDKQVFTAYLGAIARNHLHDEAVALVESVEEEYGFRPDLYILSNWFNATAHIEGQSKVEAWIREHHPSVWAEMEKLGHTVTMEGFGYRLFNIDRTLDP